MKVQDIPNCDEYNSAEDVSDALIDALMPNKMFIKPTGKDDNSQRTEEFISKGNNKNTYKNENENDKMEINQVMNNELKFNANGKETFFEEDITQDNKNTE